MSLVDIKQIEEGERIEQDIKNLQKNYDARNVRTTIDKGNGQGLYSVDEYLKALKLELEEIAGEGEDGRQTKLQQRQDCIDQFKRKKIRDTVSVQLNIVGANAAIPDNIGDIVPGIDKTIKLQLYSLDNEVIMTTDGDPCVVNMNTGILNGTPGKLTKEQDAYEPYGNFTGKVFATGEWTLESLPTDALLDNDEIKAQIYKKTIDQLAQQLAKSRSLSATVKELVGSKAVKDQIQDAVDTLELKIKQKVSLDNVTQKISDTNPSPNKVVSEAAVHDKIASILGDLTKATDEAVKENINVLSTRITNLEGQAEDVIVDKVEVTKSPQTYFSLTQKPNGKTIRAYINHLIYFEGDDFNVDRDNYQVIWTNTKAAGGFDIDTSSVKYIYFEYRVGAVKNAV